MERGKMATFMGLCRGVVGKLRKTLCENDCARACQGWHMEPRWLCVEDPFETTHNVAAVVTPEQYTLAGTPLATRAWLTVRVVRLTLDAGLSRTCGG